MSKVKVSVIVPVYNVEAYLEKCLESLAMQTLKDIEVIVVNDESPDNSEKIIAKYAKKYPHIHGYKKKNGGVSDARNYGIAKAQGEYIAFVDGDDYVTYDMYEKMYHKAVSGNFDIVVCDLNYVFEDGTTKYVSSKIDHDTTDIKKTYVNMYPCVWNKIYKKSLFKDDITFKKGVWFEDVDFLYKIFPYVKTIGVIKEAFNQYVQRQGSITKTFDKRLYNYITNFNDLIVFYEEHNLYEKYKSELAYLYVRYLYATFIKQATNFNIDEYKEAVNAAIKNVKEHFPKYRQNKYFYQSAKGWYLLIFNRLIAKIIYKIYHKEVK